jgi:uncharacterized membrane protein YfcA
MLSTTAMPTPLELALAGAAAFGAGLVNAFAGGGTLISFPTLVALGVSPLVANVTNTVALCPGYLGASMAQRKALVEEGRGLGSLFLAAGLGGLVGAGLLVLSTEALFRGLVPWLLLLAATLLAAQDAIRRRFVGEARPDGARVGVGLFLGVFLASIYGGYFGAGLGILVLAVLGLWLHAPLGRLNAVKQALSLVVNVLAALAFVVSGKVAWPYAAAMVAGSLVGGHVGGKLSGKVNPRLLRVAVIVVAVGMAARLFLRG